MKCPNCEAELEADAKFCTNCGRELTEEEQKAQILTQQQVPTTVPQTQPTIVQQQPTTPALTVQPKNSNNTKAFLITGIIVGVVILIGVVGLIILGTTFSILSNANNTPGIYDYVDSGKEIKTVTDPLDHDIKIIEDSIYIVKVDTSYLYDQAEKMRENAKLITEEEIEKLDATDIEKLALKKAIKFFSYSSYSKQELESRLEGEDFNEATIKYVVENCGADWDEQLKIEAYEILGASGTSKSSLISLLVFRGFEEAKVVKMVEEENFDFYEQAISDACFYKYTERKYDGEYTREKAESFMQINHYSEEEVRFALKVVYDELDY